MNPAPEDIGTIIQNAMESLQRGDTINVTCLARQAASIEPESEIPWLLLAVVASPEDSLAYILKALQINPKSEAAQEAFSWAQDRLTRRPAKEQFAIVEETQPPAAEPEIPPVETQIFDEVYEQPDAEGSPALDVEPEWPAFETQIQYEAFEQPIVEEIQPPDIEPEIPLDEALFSDEAFEQSIAEVPPVLVAEPEMTAKGSSIRDQDLLPEETPQARRILPVIVSEQMQSGIRPANLTNSRSSASRQIQKRQLSPVLIFLFSALAVVALAALFGLIFLRPELTSIWASIIPQNPCQASLVIGTRTFQTRILKPNSDGNYAVPNDQPERAYWVDGSAPNYVFMLSPVSINQTLISSLQAGEPTSITWSNCDTSTFSLSQPVAEILAMPALLSQNRTGITVILPWQGSSSGFVLKGTLDNFSLPVISTPDAALATIPIEEPAQESPMPINVTGFSEFLAEISLLEITPSTDLRTIQISISIHNYGNLAGRLTVCDVALTPAGSTPLAVWLTEPALPLELAPGATQTLTLTLPRPSTATATLKILSGEYELKGY